MEIADIGNVVSRVAVTFDKDTFEPEAVGAAEIEIRMFAVPEATAVDRTRKLSRPGLFICHVLDWFVNPVYPVSMTGVSSRDA